MNKKKVDALIPMAYEALENVGIAQNGKINKTFRSQISSFGAVMTMGSVLSAVAFFSAKGGSSTERQNLMKAIYMLISNKDKVHERDLFMYVNANKDSEKKVNNEIINASIALKLAMNLYELEA